MAIRSAVKIPKNIRDIEDSFSKELIELWDKRGLTGKTFWVQNSEGTVSYLLVEEHGETNTIRGFYTIPEARGLGIGSKLLGMVCEYYEALGAHNMIVNIGEGAENVYLRNKFNIIGKRKDFIDQSIAFRGILTDGQKRELEKKLLRA